MPPWAASTPRLTSRLNGRTLDMIIPTCRCRVLTKSRPHLRLRSASTQVSPTAINLHPKIPPRNKVLHDALSALGETAETQINLSRLQLALSGLATDNAVTRVAVLGLNGQGGAKRLARLLLADPLGAEEKWERELEKNGNGSQGAVLLKYGDPADNQTPNPLFKTLAVPSRVLRSHNLEVLVSTLNVNIAPDLVASTESSEESILVPKLQAPTARALPVPYPVHKTLVFGDGLDSAVAFGRFTSDNIPSIPAGVKLAIGLPLSDEYATHLPNSASTAIDVKTGEHAVTIFRDSIKNSTQYEREWFKSGMPVLSEWLIQDLHSSGPITPIMARFIASIIEEVEVKIEKEETTRAQAIASIPSVQEASASISRHLKSWAEKSHTELRDELDEAFSTRNWHKLAWWKLLWRVDDVTMISSEILERKWLTSAEKSSIYLAGRMNQAGYPDEIPTVAINNAQDTPATETRSSPPEQNLDISTTLHKSQPWFNFISSTRASLIADTIPALQALAQRLLLQTFSTTSLSSAASALLYISVPSFSVFEASAVGVLGLTISLRRMQKLWEGARESWESTVREEGRTTLKRTEDLVRAIIRGREREVVGLGIEGEERERLRRVKEIREKVDKVREILKSMEEGANGRGSSE